MDVIMYNIPPEWKRHQRRARCPYCKSEQWTADGIMPLDHDRPDGRICHALRRASDGFWTYQASEPTPDFTEVPPDTFNGTRKEWESLSPGMRREIVRVWKKMYELAHR